MVHLLIRWVTFSLIIMFVAWIIPGISIENFWAAMIAAIVIALINAVIKPVLILLTLPINIMTLGIFTLIINAVLFMFAAYLVPGIEVNSFLSAFIGSILLSILGAAIAWI